MRILLFLFIFLSPFVSAQVTDNFSDGDFTSNPVWAGDSADFTVSGTQLRSNSNTASYGFYLSAASNLATNTQWELYVNLQFNTSSANYVDIYLTSDSANLQSASHSGYFVRIGNTTDEISLYKRVSGTNTEIIDGVDLITNFSNNLIKIKVKCDASNLWTLERDMTGTGTSYVTEGSVTDATLTTSAYFGIFIQQSTATFHLKHFFDDIYVGPIIVDTTAPSIVSLTVISNTQLDVLFNENVDLTSAQTITNYSADNSLGNPSAAVRDVGNLSLVHLTFTTPFTSGLLNTLTVTGVQDLNSNAIITASTTFTYIAPVVPAYKDIIINEILADPTPQVGLPAVEFIEIYNRGTNTFNLNGWKYANGSSSGTLGNFILAPNDYLILCPMADTGLYAPYGNTMGLSSFPGLTNGGDDIKLKDNTLVVIDSVNYSDTWYKDASKKDGGWTLELINPNAASGCPVSSNWIASTNTNGGTPGIQNSVYSTAADVTSPGIGSVSVIDSLHISVCFTEAADAAQINVLTNYSISNSIGNPSSAIANTTLTCVDLTLATVLNSSTTYTLSISNMSDCSGNALTPSSATFDYYIAQQFDIVINEIMPDPDPVIDSLPDNEYIELYNRTAFAINLSGWKFTSGTNTKVLPNVDIPAQGFLTLTSTTGASLFPAGSSAVGVVSFPSLANPGQSLSLANPQGNVISAVSYTDSWYQDNAKSEGGWSLEQVDPNNPCTGISNWRASANANGGTPGMQNSVFGTNPDNTLPQLVRVSLVANDTIQLFFNESLDSTTMLNPALYVINNGIGAPTMVKPVSPDFKSARLALSTTLLPGIIYTITVNNMITDCVGNPVGTDNSARFAIPEIAAASDIVINEILTDPNTGGVDFVEIYNRSNKVIDLKTMQITHYDTINNIPIDPEIITNDGYLIFPGDYLVLSEDGNSVKSQYSTTNPEGFLDIEDLPAMSIESGTIALAIGFNVIDHFTYYENMHFPLLNVTKGVSLERIDFERPASDRTNWHSASEGIGYATPGYKNSQYNDAVETESAVEITPEIFSPDEDGTNDVVNISYHFDTPGFVGNITIYDSKGRLVKYLVRNELLGIDGAFSWDGINEEHEKARIGIYIIFTEVFDLSGNVKHYKNTCVLAGKLDE